MKSQKNRNEICFSFVYGKSTIERQINRVIIFFYNYICKQLANKYDHISEMDLLLRYYHEGDNALLGCILERYTTLLLGVCMKYLKNEEQSKDAVQLVFEKAILEVKKTKIDNIGGWLYRVAKNVCLSELRKGRTYTDEQALRYTEQPQAVPITEYWETEKQIDTLKAALKDLNESQQQCVTLFYIERKSYQEITSITGYDIKQVKSYIQNGKRNLKLKLEQQESNNEQE